MKTLESLGFEEADVKELKKSLHLPNGLYLVTGPVGSGKTTTLYAALEIFRQANKDKKEDSLSRKMNISTLEDPPEYKVEEYAQVVIRDTEDFDAYLTALLRQDPDVMLVGEIRSPITADTAVRASLTGHKVMSSLHTKNCVSTIDRMFNMGVDRKLLLGEMNAIVSQRLLKLNCEHCSEPDDILKLPDEIKGRLTEEETKHVISGTPLKGFGCKKCDMKGYTGRFAVGEFLFFDDDIRDFFSVQRSFKETVRFLYEDRKFCSMWIKGLEKVREGKVSLESMVQVISRNV